MKEFLLILRDHDAKFESFSPDDFQQVINNFVDWNRKLDSEGRLGPRAKLTSDLGRTARGRDGRLVLDGPYSEVKEAIAGFYIVKAENIEQAGDIARGCPVLGYGGSMEIREMEPTGELESCRM